MSFFELVGGQLHPVREPEDVSQETRESVLHATRMQAIELIGRPLFPIAWTAESAEPTPTGRRAARARAHHRIDAPSQLICLDPSGQIVTVEVIAELDSPALVGALADAGRNADLGRARIADLYGSGPRAFASDWATFSEACPPRTEAGPRLIIIASDIAGEVRPALESLAGSGVEVYELRLHDDGHGRIFTELSLIRAGMRPAMATMLASAERRVQLESGMRTTTAPRRPRSRHADERSGPGESEATPDPSPAPASRTAEVEAEAEAQSDRPRPLTRRELRERRRRPAENTGEENTGHPQGAAVEDEWADLPAPVVLREIARRAGGDVPIRWQQLRRGIDHSALITSWGALRLSNGVMAHDPNDAAQRVSGREQVDGWELWRVADGRTLAQLRAELGPELR